MSDEADEPMTPEQIEWVKSQRVTEVDTEECHAPGSETDRCAYAGPDGKTACGAKCLYPVSDGATLDEMTEQAAKALLYSNCSTADPNAFKGWIKDARAALNAAGIPDLLAALRVKEEVNELNRALNRELLKLIEEKAQQLHVLATERYISIRMAEALSVECARFRKALIKLTAQGDPFLARRIACRALSEPAVEEES